MIMGATRRRFRVAPFFPMSIIAIKIVEQNTAIHDPQMLAKYVARRRSSPEAVGLAVASQQNTPRLTYGVGILGLPCGVPYGLHFRREEGGIPKYSCYIDNTQEPKLIREWEKFDDGCNYCTTI